MLYLRRYVTANASMCQGWREGAGDEDPSLHHRPQQFVRHMTETMFKAANIPAGNIQAVDHNIFRVLSRSNRYDVFWGDETNRLIPTCQCKAFVRSHLPCKHMCAVMRCQLMSFDSLPQFYRNHNLVTVDVECLQMEVVQPSGESFVEPEVTCDSSSLNDVKPAAVKQSSCVVHARELRDLLHKLHNVSYLADSTEQLVAAKKALQTVYETLLQSCSTSGKFLLERQKKKGMNAQCQTHNVPAVAHFDCI